MSVGTARWTTPRWGGFLGVGEMNQEREICGPILVSFGPVIVPVDPGMFAGRVRQDAGIWCSLHTLDWREYGLSNWTQPIGSRDLIN